MITDVYIGPTPADEACEQAGGDAYQGRREMRAYIKQLKRMFGEPPEGARFRIKTFNAGEYSDVVIEVDDEDKEAMNYALKVEGHGPSKWDLFAVVELTAGIVPTMNSEGSWSYRG